MIWPAFYKIERIIRMAPIIKDLLPNNKAGLNSLINESGSNSQIKNLEDALHDKKAEIFNLRQKIKDLEAIQKDLEENLNNCRYEINILQSALTQEK